MWVRKVTEFRNHCVGHIWDNQKQRPLTHSEVMSALGAIAVPNIAEFLDWLNNPKSTKYPASVVPVVEAMRDALVRVHGIQPHEIVNR